MTASGGIVDTSRGDVALIPPVLAASTLGVLLFLLPAVAGAAMGPARGAFSRYLDAASALALDALGVLIIARLVPLRDAVWISRGLWVVAMLVAHRRRALTLRAPTPLVLLGVASVALTEFCFHKLSFPLAMWDRDWHIPLVSSLGAQRAPFDNVFLPRAALRYHYLGDAVAAMLQSLSLHRITSSRALSLAHDLYLALLATTLAAGCYVAADHGRGAWRVARGIFGATAGLLGAWAAMFASPFVLTHAPLQELLQEMDSSKLCGHSYLPFPSIAYRPHVAVAGYCIVTAFLAMANAARTSPRGADARSHTLALLSSASALALCDEASHALLAATLGLTALLVPGALGGRWRDGIWKALAFGALLPVVSAGFDASLGLGGAASYVELVDWRHLKLFDEPVALTDREAFYRVLRRDYFPQLAGAAVAVFTALWTRRRGPVAAAVFFSLLAAMSTVAALRVEVNKSPDEGHRFITACMLLAPACAAWLLASARGAWIPRLLALGVMLASGGSGWAWREAFIRHRFIVEVQPSERRWAGGYNPNEFDCGRLAPPPRRGEIPVEYVDTDIAYLWSGCQPVRLLGGASKWNLAVHGIRTGFGARAGYDAEGPDTAPTAVVCGTDPRVPWRSAPCEWALHNLRCERLGMFTRCALPLAQRDVFYRVLE